MEIESIYMFGARVTGKIGSDYYLLKVSFGVVQSVLKLDCDNNCTALSIPQYIELYT